MGSNGGVIGPANTPTASVASGLWDIDDLYQYRRAGTWPKQVASCLQTDAAVIGTDLTTYTFSTRAFGTAAVDRHVFVALETASSEANKAVSSVTIGGVAAAQVGNIASTTDGGATARSVQFWFAAVPTGATGDVVVVFAGAQSRCGIGIWAVYGLRSTTPVDDDKFEGTTSLAASMTVTTVEDGVVIAAYSSNGSAAARTTVWTGGLTERYDATIEGFQAHSGADLSGTTPGTLSPVATASAALVYSNAVVLSMR